MLHFVDLLKTLLRELVLPPVGLFVLIGIGAIIWRRRPRLAHALISGSVALLWMLSTPIFSDIICRAAEPYPPLNLVEPTHAEAIIILGGGGQRPWAPEYGGPEPEPYLLERLAYGAYVASHTHLPVLVTGNGVEAHAMRDGLVRHFGLTPRWVEDQSWDTYDNARLSAAMLHAAGIQRVILVSRGTHLRRATREFTDAGLEVIPAPTGVWAPRAVGIYRFFPDVYTLTRSYLAIYELIGEPVRAALAAMHLRRQVAPHAAAPST